MFAPKLLSEASIINCLTRRQSRAPNQINRLHESDAELVDIGADYGELLAVTTDSIAEEIASGLYATPQLMGWMTAMANFSDLAAVGAKPIGLLTAVTLPKNVDSEFVSELGAGIAAACQSCETFVLGGDTNLADEIALSASAVGMVPRGRQMMRTGCSVGDKLFLSGPAGTGNAFAFMRLTDGESDTSFFRPAARIAEGIELRNFASCCMDTSDGVLLTLDTLTRLNHCGFVIREDWERILHPAAFGLCQQIELPPWAALAGIHGEYELCFSVNAERERAFLTRAETVGWQPVLLGEVVEQAGIFLERGEKRLPLDLDSFRELSSSSDGDPRQYIQELADYVRAMESRWSHV